MKKTNKLMRGVVSSLFDAYSPLEQKGNSILLRKGRDSADRPGQGVEASHDLGVA